MSTEPNEFSAHRDLWRALSGGGDRTAADRKGRAALRRLNTMANGEEQQIDLFTPLQVPAFAAYARRFDLKKPETSTEWERLHYVAVAACAIAWIDEDAQNEPLGRALGPPPGKEAQPRFAEVRFTRLLRCDTPERLLTEVRRMVRILDGRANVYDLGQTLASWGAPAGLRRRREWAFDYWAKRDDAPAATSAIITA